MANEIIASREASSEDNAPVGPYSPIAGPHSITFFGGILALARSHQVDATELREIKEGLVVEVKDAEGRIWYVRSVGGFLSAFRNRTEQELQDLNDRMSMDHGVHFERVRLDACREIACELLVLADTMRPERCASRQRRRWLKRRITALMEYQLRLLMLRPTNAPTLRQDLSAWDLRLLKRDYLTVAA
jgi:hypothetical protein